MKSFFKYTLASLVGVFLAFILIGLIMFGSFAAMVAAATKEEKVEVKEKSLLVLKLNKPIVERTAKNPFEKLDLRSFQIKENIGLNSLLEQIDKASEDENIKGIALKTSGINAGLAQLQEIRNALVDFKQSGKYVVSHSMVYTQQSYFVASVADTIYAHPEGELMLSGMNAEILFFDNAMEKLGVEPIILRHGKFKSAVEPFMREKMSEANKEQTSKYINSIWDNMVDNMSASRELTQEKFNLIVDNLYTLDIQEAVKYNLIDKLIYDDEFHNILKANTEIEEDDDLRTVSLSKYAKAPKPKKEEDKGLAEDEIAVIYASGQITLGNDQPGNISGKKYADVVRDAREDEDIKAIVLRVNSPGGSAMGSDLIWREMKLASEEKPVIVSMSDLAASGGYYIACAADTILAAKNTLTGSIGVFGLMFNAQELMNEKLGITTDNVKTNKHSDIGSIARPMREEERKIMQKNIEDIYDTFIGHVAQGRNMAKAQVDSIGQGRVWSGIDALNIGLVDEIGGLNDAIAIAAEHASLDRYRLTKLPKQKDPIKELMKQFTGGDFASVMQEKTGKFYYYYDAMKTIAEMEGVQARLPFMIRVN